MTVNDTGDIYDPMSALIFDGGGVRMTFDDTGDVYQLTAEELKEKERECGPREKRDSGRACSACACKRCGGGRQSQNGWPKRRKLLQTGISGGIRVCQQTRRTNPALGWTLAVARGFHLSRVPSAGAAGVEGWSQ